jgi:PAS domain S-box-containing protein
MSRGEEALREQPDWYQVALASIGDAVVVTDAHGRVSFMNPMAEALTGWSLADAAGQPLPPMFRVVHERSRQPVANPVVEVIARGTVVGLANHTVLISRDGTERPIDDSAAPIRDRNGGLAGTVLVFRDISERRRVERAAEDALAYAEAIVDTIREPLVVLDAGLRVRTANRSFYQAFQVQPAETEGRLLYDLGNRQWDVPRLRKLLEEILPWNNQFNDLEVTHAFESIGKRTMLLNARRLFRRGDGTEFILLAIEDATARRSAEEGLREARVQLEQRVEERTRELAQVNEALRAEVAEHGRAEAARQVLLQQLATAQEEERHRIARELHDEMGQHLTAFSLGLKSIRDATPETSPAHKSLQNLQDLADLMGKQVHRLALELRPTALDDLGLYLALVNYVEVWSENSGTAVDFQSTGLQAERLPSPLETALYRVVQEALTNILKHARARRVSLILHRSPDQVSAVIEDDGHGFDTEAGLRAAGRLGLLGMQERLALVGGTLTVESTPANGTTVFARIPLAGSEETNSHAR